MFKTILAEARVDAVKETQLARTVIAILFLVATFLGSMYYVFTSGIIQVMLERLNAAYSAITAQYLWTWVQPEHLKVAVVLSTLSLYVAHAYIVYRNTMMANAVKERLSNLNVLAVESTEAMAWARKIDVLCGTLFLIVVGAYVLSFLTVWSINPHLILPFLIFTVLYLGFLGSMLALFVTQAEDLEAVRLWPSNPSQRIRKLLFSPATFIITT